MPAKTAVIEVCPADMPVATPCWPAALLIVATLELLEAHDTVLVSDWVLPSWKVPVAANGVDTPKATLAVAGVTEMDARLDVVTITAAVLLVIPP